MSLLEDIFLQDEANEAQELERVIDGDDYDERPRSQNSDENSEKEDEAEEDKRRVDPAKAKEKRVVKNPRFILNPARLTGPRGMQVIPEHFKDFKFKGKGHEKEDLDIVLKKLEHWAYRLYPKFQFEDCLKKIETLGKKRPVMVHLQKIRNDQITPEETVVQNDSSDEETPVVQEEDEFDKLLQQQIELARATPAPGSVKKIGFRSPGDDRSPIIMTKATSSPSISDEQKERMLRNRRLAEERRLAKLKQNQININISTESNPIEMNNISKEAELSKPEVPDKQVFTTEVIVRKHNRSQIIDSSDEEGDMTSINQSISVEIHKDNIDSNCIKYTIVEKIALVMDTNEDFGKKQESNEIITVDNIINDSKDSQNDSSNMNVENSEIDCNKNTNQEKDSDSIIVEEYDIVVKHNVSGMDTEIIKSNEQESEEIITDHNILNNSKGGNSKINSKNSSQEIDSGSINVQSNSDKETFNESRSEQNNEDIKLTENKEKCISGDNNIIEEEIMDIDFADDF